MAVMAVEKDRKRRDYGSGSVYQRASDGRWVATVEAGWTANSTRRRLTRTAATEAQAKVKLREILRTLDDGASANPRTTVKQWAEEWLPIVERSLRPKSYRATSAAVWRWIIPAIGHKRLNELSPADWRKVDATMRREGLVGSSRLRHYSTFVSMLKAARAEGHGVPVRVLEVPAPRKSSSDREAPSTEQCVALLRVASTLPDGSRWADALLHGHRQAESLGLTWDAIDFEAHTVEIAWQLQALPYNVRFDRRSGFRVPDEYEARQVKGALHLVRPKSKAGVRIHPLLPWMESALIKWRDQAPTNKLGLVWPTAKGEPRVNRDDDQAWYALQDAAEVRHPAGRHYTIHEARHATATLLLEAGIDPAVVIAIMGQSTILSTRPYQHVRLAPMREALGEIAERLELGS